MTVAIIKIKPVHPDARMPERKSDRAAAYDCAAVGIPGGSLTIPPGGFATVGTGLSCEFPSGWCLKVFSRSGHGFKLAVSLSNSVGLIDEDYTGEIQLSLRNDGSEPFVVRDGDRVAQLKFEKTDPVELLWWTDALHETARGANGFGSTGVAAEGSA